MHSKQEMADMAIARTDIGGRNARYWLAGADPANHKAYPV